MNFPIQEVVHQAELLAAWTGVTKPNPWDMFFLVMGRTGSGKSTFIRNCTGRNATVGHGLYSCTSEVAVYDYQWNGRRIFLVDTPGFNDTRRPDVEVLETLASSLSTSYGNGVRIHGIILLHPMSDNRISGSSLRTIDMMKAMCGFARYDNLAIVTTMWPSSAVGNTNHRELEFRYAELFSEDRFFGELVNHGAEAFRYEAQGRAYGAEGEVAAAQRVVAHLIRRSDMHPLGALQLQREILVEGKTLGQTAVGLVVAGDLHRNQQTHRLRLRQAEDEMRSESAQRDARHLAEIRELNKDIIEGLRLAEAGKETLKKSIQDMHRDGLRQCRKGITELDGRFRAHIEAKEQELRDMEASRLQLQASKAIRPPKSQPRTKTKQDESHEAEQEHILGDLRKEVVQARDAHSKFTSYKSNILNGATNGIAAGLTAGALAAAAAGGTGLLLCSVM